MRTKLAPETTTSHFHCVTFMLGGSYMGSISAASVKSSSSRG